MMRALDARVVNATANLLGENSTLFWFVHTYWEDTADPRTKGYTLVDISNVTISLAMIVYTLLVWVIIPRYMRKREPYNLKNAIIFYDFFMVRTSIVFVMLPFVQMHYQLSFLG